MIIAAVLGRLFPLSLLLVFVVGEYETLETGAGTSPRRQRPFVLVRHPTDPPTLEEPKEREPDARTSVPRQYRIHMKTHRMIVEELTTTKQTNSTGIHQADRTSST